LFIVYLFTEKMQTNSAENNSNNNVNLHDIDGSSEMNAESNSNGYSWKDVVIKRKGRELDSVPQTTQQRDPRLVKRAKTANDNITSHNFETLNRFNVLPISDSRTEANQNKPADTLPSADDKPTKPPPIHLRSSVEFIKFNKFLTSLIGAGNYTCKVTREGTAIFTNEPIHYRTVIRSFRENDAEFFTYQLKEDKAYRVVIRGLHQSIETTTIATELQELGYNVRTVTNVLNREKVKLPLFYVDLEPDRKNSTIFNLTSLLYCKIAVEEPRKSRLLAQCIRCQRYGHTKHYCTLPPRCVKCAGNHESTKCPRAKTETVRCVLCGTEGHPGNYRGCKIHREIQHRHASKNASNRSVQSANVKTVQPPTISSFPPLPPTSAGPFTATPRVQTSDHRDHSSPNRNYSYKDALNGDKHTYGYGHVYGPNEISYQLSSFLGEMKNLLTPIISVMSQLMQLLLQNNAK
jgi:hypothetical protein